MNKKYKNLSSNIILFSVSSFGHKILAFLLVPLYTNFLTTEQYGAVDLIATTVNLLIPLFTLNIFEAVMRFTIEDKQNDSYLGVGVKLMLQGAFVLLCLLALLWYLPVLEDYKNYYMWIFVIYLLNAIYSIVTNYLRATDRVSTMVIGSLINSIITLVLDVVFIAYLGWGINGYYIAMAFGLGSSIVYMGVAAKIHRHLGLVFRKQPQIQKECLVYCVPTIFTALSWWINSSLDRYFVTAMCGVEQNGIYSVAYKIPTILGVFQSIFNQAWVLSAIKEFDREDSDGFFGGTYELYNSMMVLVTSWIMLFNIPLSTILYAKDFFVAWQYVPMLLISTLFSALAGYMGGAYTAVKDTKTCAYTVIVGAIINMILNSLLIPLYGVQGAAIATAVAYVVSWAMRMILIRKYIRMKIHLIKDIFIYVLLLIQLVISLTESHLYVGQVAILMIIILLYFRNYQKAIWQLIRKGSKGDKG